MSYSIKNYEYYTANNELNNRIDEIILFREYIEQVLDEIKKGSYDVEIINKIAQYGEKIMNKQIKFNPRVVISNDVDSDSSELNDVESDLESDVEVLTTKALDNTNSNVSSISYHKNYESNNTIGYSYEKPNQDYKKYYADDFDSEYKTFKNSFDDQYDKYDKYDDLADFYDKKENNNLETEKKPFYQTQNYITQDYFQKNYGTYNYYSNYFQTGTSQIYSNVVDTKEISNNKPDDLATIHRTNVPDKIESPVKPNVDTLAVNFIKNNIPLDKYNYLKSFNLDRINKFCQNCMSY